jgi:hypothetical protein
VDGATDFDYLAARLHARWSQAVRGPELRALLDSGIPALARTLAGREIDIARPAEIQKQLTLQLAAELEAMAGEAGGASPAAAWFRCFTGRLFLENLKTLLRQRLQPQPEGELAFLLLDGPGIPPLDTARFLAAPALAAAAPWLPPTPFTAGAVPVLAAFDRQPDLFAASTRLDTLFHETLATCATTLPPPMRPAATDLAAGIGDLFNLVLLLRNREVYRLPAGQVRPLLAPVGSLARGGNGTLALLSDATLPPERFLAALPAAPRAQLAPVWAEPLHHRENQLWAGLYRRACRWFNDFAAPGSAAAAYPLLRQMEWRNLCRLFEGLRFHLEPAELRALLLCLD